MKPEEFPALYRSADDSALVAQQLYLRLIRLQYALLFLAATISLSFGSSPSLYIAYAVMVGISSALLLYMSIKKPEKDWYGCRALAESIKTSTWRYMMRADPFEDTPTLSEVRSKFAGYLSSILRANSHVGESISRRPYSGEQITASMDAIRALSLEMRREHYRTDRIDEQRAWYVARVKANRRQFRAWVTACITVQAAAIVIALLRILYDQQWAFWPTEPLLVLSASIVGWIQIKKFNELASAYSLTAHEIGIIQSLIDHVRTEADFSEFVNEAERAFSREHTQWVARQTG